MPNHQNCKFHGPREGGGEGRVDDFLQKLIIARDEKLEFLDYNIFFLFFSFSFIRYKYEPLNF